MSIAHGPQRFKTFAALVLQIVIALGALGSFLLWLGLTPKDLTVPHWVWLLFGLFLFAVSILSSGSDFYHSWRNRNQQQIFIAPQGTPIRVGQADASVNVTILSYRRVELAFLKADVTCTNGLAFTAEYHEPTMIPEFTPVPMSFLKPLTEAEMKRLAGITNVSVNGYGKFRDQPRVDFQWTGPISQ